MSILTNKTINNFANNKSVRSFTSKLCTPGNITSVILLESTVLAGRTYQAKKRGGDIEGRERFTEEAISSVIWLWGTALLNKGFDFLITKVGKIKEKTGVTDFNFDTGNDNIRQPFEHVTKNLDSSKKHLVSTLKFSKIVASTAIAVGFMGFILPKINQNITKNIMDKKNQGAEPSAPIKISPKQTKKLDINEFLTMAKGSAGDPKSASSQQAKKLDINEFLTMSRGSAGDPNFSSGTFFEVAAHQLENDSTTQLLTIDGGLFTGRAVNARNKYERREILFRDLSSSFFYLASTPLIYKGLCALDKLQGKNTHLSPEITDQLHDKLEQTFAADNTTLTKEQFKAKVFGTKQVSEGVFNNADKIFENEITTVDKMHKFIDSNVFDATKAAELKAKAQKLSALQPKKNDIGILTKSQLTNLFHNGILNEPEFINKLINDSTEGKAMNPVKFISQAKVDEKRDFITDYAKSILTQADKDGSGITKDLLKKMKTRNLITKLGYWGTGMAVSAFFLSTAIPKIQYWMTKKSTGNDDFPGIQQYKKQQ